MAESIDVGFITRLIVENSQLRERIAKLEETQKLLESVNDMWMKLVELHPESQADSTPFTKSKRKATTMVKSTPSASKKGKVLNI
jgi:hypothetical protein